MISPFLISAILLSVYHWDIIMISPFNILIRDCSDTIVCLSQWHHYDHTVPYLCDILCTYYSDIIMISPFDIFLWDCTDTILCLSQRYYHDLTVPNLCDTIVCLSQRYHYDMAIRYFSTRLQWYHCVLIAAISLWHNLFDISLRGHSDAIVWLEYKHLHCIIWSWSQNDPTVISKTWYQGRRYCADILMT